MKAVQTLAAINAHYVKTRGDDKPRKYLGASAIGDDCSRKLWYGFRHCSQEKFEGRMLRLFERGHLEEKRFINFLESIGCTVWADNGTGQFTAKALGGHFSGSIDGVVKGMPDLPFPKEPALLEMKTHNDKSYKLLINQGILKSKYQHYIQMQTYMHLMKLKQAVYMAVNKNDDNIHIEVIQLNPDVVNQVLQKASSIIFTNKPPPKCSQDPSWWKCRFCSAHSICHGNKLPPKSCRTCKFAQPMVDGGWKCEFNNSAIHTQVGCQDHEYIPELKK
tara:strand:+ start:2170 stop:2997 length:828 start_codon:yes stop_codon:yes gene_type:complete